MIKSMIMSSGQEILDIFKASNRVAVDLERYGGSLYTFSQK
jgi:hypothetical protein